MQKAAIIFHRFGPYHVARLRGAARQMELLAIEESAESSEYAWDAVTAGNDFPRLTLLRAGEQPARAAAEIAGRLRRALDEYQPGFVVIPGWSDPAALAALTWALDHGARAVVMSESTAWDEARRPWKEWVKARIVRLCSAALVGGTPHAEYVQALGMPAGSVVHGYDAVDNDHFAAGARRAREDAVARRAALSLPENYFLASTRFLPRKNLSMLLRAFAAFRKETGASGWELVILGDGEERATLERQLTELGLRSGVRLPGFRQYDELPAFYGLAQAFIHPSSSEPWGLVVNEAMAAGLPVLVSDRCGCARDLVSVGANGYTFDPTDEASLTALLRRLWAASPEVRVQMGEVSRHRVASFSADAFGVRLREAIDAGAARPAPQRTFIDHWLLAALLRRSEQAAARLLPAPATTAAA